MFTIRKGNIWYLIYHVTNLLVLWPSQEPHIRILLSHICYRFDVFIAIYFYGSVVEKRNLKMKWLKLLIWLWLRLIHFPRLDKGPLWFCNWVNMHSWCFCIVFECLTAHWGLILMFFIAYFLKFKKKKGVISIWQRRHVQQAWFPLGL